MSAEAAVVRQKQVSRFRWWIHLILIGGYVAAAIPLGLLQHRRQPALLATAEGRTAVERIVDLSAMRHNRAYFWLAVTVASFVVAGLREELWRSGTLAAMRALWPGLFQGRDGQIAAVALIAIVFGLAHLTLGLLPVAMAMILGFLLGIIMVVHQSIWPAVNAHGMFDATSFALAPIALEHLYRAH